MKGIFDELSNILPEDVINVIKKSINFKIYFFDHTVSISTMYLLLIFTTILLLFLIYLK